MRGRLDAVCVARRLHAGGDGVDEGLVVAEAGRVCGVAGIGVGVGDAGRQAGCAS